MTGNQDIVHPALAGAARAAAQRLSYLGPILSSGSPLRAIENGVVLEVRLDSSPAAIVGEVRHQGAGDSLLAGVLDVFCDAIEGLPLREAADHGTIHVLERLRGGHPTSMVPGILTPRSAGSAFRICERLIRGILVQRGPSASTGTNFWNPVLSQAWRAQTAEQRIATLQPMIDAFRAARQLSPEDFYLVRIEKARRIVLGFGPNVRHERKGPLLRELERDLRRSTGDRLEIYMDEMKDDNAIRRLAPSGDLS
jgi:hypothetical protein